MAKADLATMIRARTTCLWITSREELRMERLIATEAGRLGYGTVLWDCSSGTTDTLNRAYGSGRQSADPERALKDLASDTRKGVWILRDMDSWLASPTTARLLKNTARDLQRAPMGQERVMVILSAEGKVPSSLRDTASVVEWDLPTREETGRIYDEAVDAAVSSLRAKGGQDERISALEIDKANGGRELAIDSALGLTAEEMAKTFAMSLVRTRRIDPDAVRKEKATVIGQTPGLTWNEPDPEGLRAVGGLANVKNWLARRVAGFTPEARTYGLPAPKGLLVVGVSGTGKSLLAKCVATTWKMPLLRLDLGAVKDKWMGASEANIRAALRMAEAVSPCVLWLDEIEKMLGGSSEGDSGVGKDQLGSMLSWMQDHTAPVFVIATANDVSALPPEFLRKGRFDELFFVDLPTETERVEIAAAALRKYARTPDMFDLETIAARTDGFTGAEIASLVPEAMFAAFPRELVTEDILDAIPGVVPLSKTAAEKITALRTWAQGRARPAATTTTGTASTFGRRVSID